MAGLWTVLMAAANGGAILTDPWDKVPPNAESLLQADFPIQPGNGWRLQLGGHARSMSEAYRNPDFGFKGVDEDAWIHHRIEALISLENAQHFKFATELIWGEMEGKDQPLSPVDGDMPDFLQLYAHGRLPLADKSELVLRAGRQMLIYGSGRLLSHREGANQRLAHDAFRLSWRRGDWQVDSLLASPVRIQPGAFDNRSHFDQTKLWGIYATGASCLGEGHGTDIYYLGLRQEDAPLSPGRTETRHTFGTRWFGSNGDWSYNHEFILQTGDSGGRDILAGAISLGAGRVLHNLPLKPTLGFKADAVSGGGNQNEVRTFHPLFQGNNYFNEGGFVSPSNLWNLNPVLDLQLHHTVSLSLGVNFLWRFAPGDSVYAPPFNAIAGPAPHGERYLGTAWNLAMTWEPHPSCSFSLGFTHHEAGASITSLGGKSVDYLQVAARLEF